MRSAMPSGKARDHRGGWRGRARPAMLLCVALLSSSTCLRRSTLPAAVSSQEFWRLIEEFSEPAGTFSISENLVSNEPLVAENARRLRAAGGIYIGVGPEQNYTYIARLRPVMAFIIDIRRENRNLHLLYKALFELSTDRADFVSRLFSRPRPPDVASTASVNEIFDRFEQVPASRERQQATAALVRDRLLTAHGLPLDEADLDWMGHALGAFAADGPEIHFWGSRAVTVDSIRPSYRWLMTSEDHNGQTRSFLSTEESFAFVRELHARNLIVPLVGDFSGRRALQHAGDYARSHGELVRAFYGSNVGVYLNSEQTAAFCRNLAALPAAPDAWFIESDHVRSLASKLRACRPRATDGHG